MGVVTSGGSMPSVTAFVGLSASVNGLSSGDTIPFNTVFSDIAGYFDAVSHRYVVPSGKAGLHLIGLSFDVFNVGAGNPVVVGVISVGGNYANLLQNVPRTAGDSSAQGAAAQLVPLADGDSLTPHFSFPGGDTISVRGSTDGAGFWIVKIA